MDRHQQQLWVYSGEAKYMVLPHWKAVVKTAIGVIDTTSGPFDPEQWMQAIARDLFMTHQKTSAESISYRYGQSRYFGVRNYLDSIGTVELAKLRTSNIFLSRVDGTIYVRELNMEESFCDSFILANGTFNNLKLQNVWIRRNLQLHNLTLHYASLNNVVLPERISLRNINLSQLSERIDLTSMVKLFDTTYLYVENVDLSKLRLNYSHFQLEFPERYNIDRKMLAYQQLLHNAQADGFYDAYEKLDKEFKALKYGHMGNYVLGVIDKYWWDYGYNKGLVISNSAILFLVCVLINTFVYSKLKNAYHPSTIHNFELKPFKNKANAFMRRMVSCFIYTGYVFWGIKLDFKEVEIKPALVLIFIEYIVGLVCLAYIANFIITK